MTMELRLMKPGLVLAAQAAACASPRHASAAVPVQWTYHAACGAEPLYSVTAQSSAMGRHIESLDSIVTTKRRPRARGNEYCASGRAGEAKSGRASTTLAEKGIAKKIQNIIHLPGTTVPLAIIMVCVLRAVRVLLVLLFFFSFPRTNIIQK
jgi:hypothetical protein